MQFSIRHVSFAAAFFFVAINGATAQETDKNKFPLGGTVSGKTIPPQCVVSQNEDGENISITLRGYLAPKTSHHPVQGKFTRTVLVLEQAVCFEHLESWGQMFPGCHQDCAVSYLSHVQIDDFEQPPDYARPVTVTGKTFLGHTGWHLTPIMIYVDSIELRGELTSK